MTPRTWDGDADGKRATNGKCKYTFLENVTVPRGRGSRPANVAKRGDPMDFRWKVVGNSEDHSRPWLGRGDTASRTRGTREM